MPRWNWRGLLWRDVELIAGIAFVAWCGSAHRGRLSKSVAAPDCTAAGTATVCSSDYSSTCERDKIN